ncbi:MAG: hypothetical protein NUW01_01580, partial [Gemmatimonadaceae bacterium]|nr:hypothetical protein [Gemmatimonadaceae bacterium]
VTYDQTLAPASSPVRLGVARTLNTPTYTVATPRSLWLWDAQVSQPSGYVSAWADQSGTGNDFAQATVIQQPEVSLFNGRPSTRFRGDPVAATIKHVMAGTLTGATDDYTVFGVFDQKVLTAIQNVLGINGGTGSISPRDSTSSVGIYDGMTWRPTAAAVLGQQVLTWRLDSAGLALACWRDGVSLGGAAWDGSMGPGVNVSLGALLVGGTQPLNAELPELLVYNRLLATAEQSQVEAYLAARYGL